MSHQRTIEHRRHNTTTFRAMRMHTRRGVAAVGGTVLALASAGCAQDAPQDTWQPKGDNAQKIQDLQWPVFLVAGIVLVIVAIAVGWSVWRYRDRGQEMPEQTHGKPSLEIALTILPALILVGVGIPTVRTVFQLAKTSDSACVINVTGQQWWWEYDYPSGMCGDKRIERPIITSGELVIPTEVNVLLTVTSRDVIHSFWIPNLNGKKDAVPGRVHTLRMEANEPGYYEGQCTEFCGLSHSRMRMAAVGLDKDDFSAWVDNQLAPYEKPSASDEAALAAETAFNGQCSRCHQVNGLETTNADGTVTPVLSNPDEFMVSGAAPNLTNLLTRVTFAGGTYDLLRPGCRSRLMNASPEEFGAIYLEGVTPECLNETELREWLRNAPAKKAMYANEVPYRGMPNLNLTDDQIDELIAYLLERK
jgi:cytochrome c oxidase subunit II